MKIVYKEFEVTVKRYDYKRYFEKLAEQEKEERKHKKLNTNTLIQYDQTNSVVTVDTDMKDKDYIKWAVVHECVCCGTTTEFSGLELPKPGDPTRCMTVEMILLTSVIPPEYREKYARQRVEMFHALLDLELNKKFNASFNNSLAYLRGWLDGHTGTGDDEKWF